MHAGAVVDDHGLAPQLGHLAGDHAHGGIGRGTGGERHNDAHGLFREFGRMAGQGRQAQRKAQCQESQGQEALEVGHGNLHS